ncbi:MAG: hypothetical protein J1F12_05830 [Muribaculaceae bacterium]|nr:hypothetical protein [Muribaculaceae bacterium]
MDIIEAIKKRHSVRSYQEKPLSKEELELLQKAIDSSFTLFGGKLTIRLKSFDLKEGFKPSTYGFIKGASDFFLLGVGNDEVSALTAGFQFEQVVLKATEMGLGTCWIAATFKGTDFERNESWPEGESLKLISPVGYPEKPRLIEKLGRKAMGSDHRLPISKLFFEDDFQKTLNEENEYMFSLEMLRLAPSSTNSQPWRILIKDNKVMFYYKPKSQVAIVDMGIGICHFYEAEKFKGFKGEFFKEEKYQLPPEDWKYLISYKRT